MEIIIGAIVAGIVLGWLDVFNYKWRLWLNRVSTGCLFVMLLCLGAKIGCDSSLLAQIKTLGVQSLILGGSAILGTMAMFMLVAKILAPDFKREEEA
ncbi:LysO family transporter [Phascolarctobacterium sp.]|uniref:LysO family transporter n=1 Tax=Phascolarctobacterium sp. TaxID=2049039 RepID=UPI0038698CFA